MGDDKDIIDLTPYLETPSAKQEEAFAVYGGAGTGSRFALPVWRSIYLLGGDRGAVLAVDESSQKLDAVFILDLKTDPARRGFPMTGQELLDPARAGNRLIEPQGSVGEWAGVLLGEKGGKVFFVVVTGVENQDVLEDFRVRQDFSFLSGECAGLVLHWGLDEAREKES